MSDYELFDLVKNQKFNKLIKIIKKQKDIDYNLRDEMGNYLIQYLVMFNQVELTELLIQKGAKIDFIDNDGRTIMYLPIKYGYDKMLEILLKSDKEVSMILVNLRDYHNYTPIFYAVMFGNINALNILDKYHVDYNLTDNKGYTVFHTSVKMRNIQMVKKLIIKSDINKANKIGETPLHTACNNEDIEIVKLLIEKNVDVNRTDYIKNLTPLIYICILGNNELVKLLKEKNLEYNIQDYNGNTALHYAAMGNYSEIINELYNKSKLDLTNIDGKTITHIILERNNFENDNLIKLNFDKILKQSKMNIQDNEGITILHYLAKYNIWEEYVDILKIKKNNIFIKDSENKSPLDYVTNKDKFIDIIAKSYLYNLRKNNKQWKEEWENLCKNKLSFNELKKKDKELAKKVKNKSDDVCLDLIKYYIIHKNISLPLKINYDCIYISKDIVVDVATFTGTTLDIIFGLIYLQQKYNNICTTLTKNIIKNPELDKYYNSLGIVKSYKVEYLNFEIIWVYQKIFYPTTLENIIETKLKKCDYLIIPLGIEMSKGSHGNILIYDKNINEIERFEPNGSSYPYGFNYNPSLLDKILEKKFTNLIKGVKYVKPNEYLPKVGFQLIESQEDYKKTKIGDPGGFCATWSLWYADMRIKFSKYDRKKIVNKLIKKIRLSDQSFKELIRNYSRHITDIRDKYLKKINIDINDWLNDNYNMDQLDNLHNHIYELIDS